MNIFPFALPEMQGRHMFSVKAIGTYWPRVRSKASGLVQVIKGYRSGSRYGSKIAAVRAQISVDDARGVYRFVALTEAGGVAELFEFPTSWGIWILREEIAARDEKARGRWSKQV